MNTIRQRVSLRIKEFIFNYYRIPFSREFVLAGLETGFVPFPKPAAPITLVDVGSSSGQFSTAVNNYCGIRKALLVEPQPNRFKELQKRFNDSRFHFFNCAVADRNCVMEMSVLNHDYSSSLLQIKPEVGGVGKLINLGLREKISVKVRTLDDLLAEVAWTERIDLLKIDIQGAELQALKGAQSTLARTDMVLTEISFRPQYVGSAVFSDVYDFLYLQGFLLLSLHEGFRGQGGELLQGDALFVRAKRIY